MSRRLLSVWALTVVLSAAGLACTPATPVSAARDPSGPVHTATIGRVQSNNLGLVGRWSFDGPTVHWDTGKVNDISGNNNTGTLVSMSTTTSPVAGKIGQALKFNLNKSVSVGDNASLDMTNTITVAGWVYPTDLTASAYPALVDKARNSQWAFVLDYAAAGSFGNQLRAIVNIGGVRRDCTTSGLVNNRWQFVAFSYDGSQVRIYKDGIDQNASSCSWGGAIGTSAASLSIGKLSDLAGLIGKIDDVRIYNRALSANEVKQLYAAGATNVAHSNTVALSSGLVGRWSFDGPTVHWDTGKVNDISGNNNTGQLISMSTTTSPVAGKIGQGLKFDGANDYGLIASNSNLRPTNNFTISALAKFNSLSGSSMNAIVQHDEDGGGNDGYVFRESASKAQFAALNNNGFTAQSVDSAQTLIAGKWYHIAGIYRNSKLEIYINGVLDNSKSASGGVIYSVTTAINIGRRGGTSIPNTQFMNGTLDDVRIYNRALSAQEVKQLYLMGK